MWMSKALTQSRSFATRPREPRDRPTVLVEWHGGLLVIDRLSREAPSRLAELPNDAGRTRRWSAPHS
jgi:hypothetical protein